MAHKTGWWAAAAAGAVVMLAAAAAVADDGAIPLLNYHDVPPFNDADGGLTRGLAVWLDRAAAVRLKSSTDPRRRIDAALAAPFPAIVAWVHPAWFGDAKRERYDWTEPLAEDANAVLSPAARPLDYAGPGSLEGRLLAGVAGYRYLQIDQAVAAGRLTRIDSSTEEALLRLVAAGRVDAAIVGASIARALLPRLGLADRVHVSPRPQQYYGRRLLLHQLDAAAARRIQAAVNGRHDDPAWQDLMGAHFLAAAPAQTPK